ncbi:hypothetical protein [Microbacterium hydrocarbonoxydans]|uniref:hypothetical protein n=1 Tax=Microbacterium hydrocarbonoxydans TaxID=273678 RepID=UPI003D950BC1
MRAARVYRAACDREYAAVLEALAAASGRSADDAQGCGCTVTLTFNADGRAVEVLLTQRQFITVSATDFASRLGAEIVSADAEHIRLRR